MKSRRCARPGAEAQLAVIPKHTTAHDGIFAAERCAAGVHRFDHAVFQRVMPPGQNDRAVLGHVGGIAETQSSQLHIVALHPEDFLAHGSLHMSFVEIAAGYVPHEQGLVCPIDEERSRRELSGVKDLAEQIAVHPTCSQRPMRR